MSSFASARGFAPASPSGNRNGLVSKFIAFVVAIFTISFGCDVRAGQAAQIVEEDELPSERIITLDQLAKINEQWNSLKQFSDLELYGLEDKWSTPAETLALGAGDCEDLAIGKYFTLLNMGVPEEHLFLLSANMTGYGAHMVLTIDTPHGTLVLDNMTREIKRLTDRRDLQVVYKLNRSVMKMTIFGNKQFNPSINQKWVAMLNRLAS